MTLSTREPVAIIGAGCRFPGDISTLDSFWDALVSRVDAICDIPADRWTTSRFYCDTKTAKGKMYIRKGGFEPETGLLNRDEEGGADASAGPPEPEAAAAPTGAISYHPLSLRARLIALAVAVIGFLGLLIPGNHFGESPNFQISTTQARAAADAFLKAQNLDVSAFEHVTYPAVHWAPEDSLAAKYMLERRPVATATALFQYQRPVQHWATRYFKSLDQEEYTVSVHPETGKLLGFFHTLPEDRPGADIPADRARELATAFATSQGLDLSTMDLKESSSEKKKARRDYALVWEARPGDARNVDEARYRIEIGVDGDSVSSLRRFWKLPETFTRGREQKNALSITVVVMRIAGIAGAIVYALWLLIQSIRQRMVPWRSVIWLAAGGALLFPITPLLSMHLALKDYNTAIPLGTYQAVTYVVLAMSLIFGFIFMGGAAALITTFCRDGVAAFRALNRRLLGADALLAVLAAAGIGFFLSHLESWLMTQFHSAALFSFSSPDLIASGSPAVSAVADALRSILSRGAILVLAAVLVHQLRNAWMLVPVSLLVIFIGLPGDVHSGGEFLLYYAFNAISLACAAAFCFWIARGNYLAYALVIWILGLRAPMATLFANVNPGLQIQGWAIGIVLVLSLVWAVVPALRPAPPPAHEPQPGAQQP